MITLDIETTGLYPAKHPPDFIVGIGVLTDFEMRIFTAPHYDFTGLPLPVIEDNILKDFTKWLMNQPQDEIFLTYNGRKFDIPFIATKLIEYGNVELADNLFGIPNIDLIHYAKSVTGRWLSKDDCCRKLGNLYVPRKTDGLWSARIYKHPYLLTKNDHLQMIHHNAVDLTATARLYNVVKEFPDYDEWRKSEMRNDGKAQP
jgi:uncharacterized protein YprB with RNaseH-like and TPR domain